MTLNAFIRIRGRIAATVPALDRTFLRFERIAGSPFIVLVAEVAFHVAMAAAFSFLRVNGETIVTDQHNRWVF